MEVLLANNKIRAATHNIMAYRIESPDKPGVFQQVGGAGGALKSTRRGEGATALNCKAFAAPALPPCLLAFRYLAQCPAPVKFCQVCLNQGVPLVPEPSWVLCLQDCDDDGEQAAGGRLLHLLQACPSPAPHPAREGGFGYGAQLCAVARPGQHRREAAALRP